MSTIQINMNFDLESTFVKTPKKRKKFDDEYSKEDKKKGKKDYSKQRERKREAFE